MCKKSFSLLLVQAYNQSFVVCFCSVNSGRKKKPRSVSVPIRICMMY